jgi:hypothetical protein
MNVALDTVGLLATGWKRKRNVVGALAALAFRLRRFMTAAGGAGVGQCENRFTVEGLDVY